MMMETVVYSREYLFVKELYDTGELGRIQFLRGSRTSRTWTAGPATGRGCRRCTTPRTASSPCLALVGKHAEHVVCHGSGRIGEELILEVRLPVRGRDGHDQAPRLRRRRRGDPQPLQRPPASTARASTSTADKNSFEWQQVEARSRSSTPVIPEAEIPERVEVPDFAHLLPEPIRKFTTKGVYSLEDEQHLSFIQGGGHGGSHPHLVHAWLSAIRGERPALPDAATVGQLDDGRHLRPRVGHEGRARR